MCVLHSEAMIGEKRLIVNRQKIKASLPATRRSAGRLASCPTGLTLGTAGHFVPSYPEKHQERANSEVFCPPVVCCDPRASYDPSEPGAPPVLAYRALAGLEVEYPAYADPEVGFLARAR